jgi:integrase
VSMERGLRTQPGEGSLSPIGLVELVVVELARSGWLAPPSFERLAQLQRRFGLFLTDGLGVETAAEVSPQHARAFVEARRRDEGPPSVATMHLRRSAIRLLFREARRMGLTDVDPTRALNLPPRSPLRTRPLSDDEIALCRSFSVKTMTETRQPAALALAEATARCSEIPAITVADLDLDRARVWMKGTTATEARWGRLTTWGAEQLARRLERLGPDPATPVVCAGSRGRSGAAASAHRAIAGTLRRAGLGSEPDVRPNSIVAWRGVKALSDGTRIEEVALLLGMRSLDRTAEFIGWRWEERRHASQGRGP